MAKGDVKRQREVLAATYGAHVPLRMQIESEILSQYRRLPTLQSSMVGLDTLAGRDTQINISDVFGELRCHPCQRRRARRCHTALFACADRRVCARARVCVYVCACRLCELAGRSAGRPARRYGGEAGLDSCSPVDDPSW